VIIVVVVLRVGGVTIVGVGSSDRFLLGRDLLLRCGEGVVTVIVVAERPSLIRCHRGILRFFVVGILALVQ
jgi:hypothetical protein